MTNIARHILVKLLCLKKKRIFFERRNLFRHLAKKEELAYNKEKKN